jgi:hypothetical protein
VLRSTISVWLPAIWVVEATARGLHVHEMIGILPDKAREVFGIPEGYEAWTGSRASASTRSHSDITSTSLMPLAPKATQHFQPDPRRGSPAGILGGFASHMLGTEAGWAQPRWRYNDRGLLYSDWVYRQLFAYISGRPRLSDLIGIMNR